MRAARFSANVPAADRYAGEWENLGPREMQRRLIGLLEAAHVRVANAAELVADAASLMPESLQVALACELGAAARVLAGSCAGACAPPRGSARAYDAEPCLTEGA